MNTLDKTIFGPATLVGDSGISVIRISGDQSVSVVSRIFSLSPKEFIPAKVFEHNSALHGYLFDDNKLIDEIIVNTFIAPSSFTGETVVEISSHGGAFIFRKINGLLLKLGLYPSEPGEFSKRAYLNGKIDLAQAESIADLIKARTESSNSLALKQLTGEFSSKIQLLRDDLINYCSLLELELDFSDEGIDLVSRETLLENIDKLIQKFRFLTRSFESGKIIQNGVNLAIIGRPNVGKSTIFNFLLDENRAITSDIPGTTRDFLRESLIIDGILFNIIDTAGIRFSEDVIEQEGVRRSRQKIDESDIVLDVWDLGNISDIAESINGADKNKTIKVYNKADVFNNNKDDGISVSAKTGYKMDKLQEEILKRAKTLINLDDSSDLIITNERHRDCLLKTCEHLVNARKQILSGGGNELISYDIRSAMDSVAEILGKVNNVDILNNIFSKFCIGK